MYANTGSAGSYMRFGGSGQVLTAPTTLTMTYSNTSVTAGYFMLSIAPATAPVPALIPTSTATPTINQFFNLYTTFVGFANAAISATVTGSVVVGGVVSGLSGLVAGKTYYLADSAGTISTTAGTNTKKVGIALSTTTLLITNNW
jgi:hypothetical protein